MGRNIIIKKIVGLSMFFTFCIAATVFGHGITNEKTLYDDLEFTKVQEEVVFMRALGVLSGEDTNVFRPQDQLTMEDVAFFSSRFHGYAGHSDSKETAIDQALENNLVDSLEGNATYADVNHAYFEGKAPVDSPDGELTREEFVVFMSQFLSETIDGQTLFEMKDWTEGPTGVIEAIEYEVLVDDDEKEAYKEYTLTIEGEAILVNDHARIYQGPIDLSAWEGKNVEESWLTETEDGKKQFNILVAEDGQFSNEEIADTEIEIDETIIPGSTSKSGGFPAIPVIVGALLLIAVIGFVFMRKRNVQLN